MKTASNTGTPLRISVRQTAQLAAKGKGWPERTLVPYLQRAFDRLDVPYEIVWDLPPVEGIPSAAGGKTPQLTAWSNALNGEGNWSDGPVPAVCKDSNILLTDRAGGGLSYGRMKAGIAPGRLLEDYGEMVEWVTPDDPRHTVFGFLHEVAHNIGTHGNQHRKSFGRVWQDADAQAWYRTPTGTPNEVNLCGTENDKKRNDWEKRDCLYFADCAKHHLLIRDQ